MYMLKHRILMPHHPQLTLACATQQGDKCLVKQMLGCGVQVDNG